MTAEISLWVLGILVGILGFISGWLFHKTISLGESISAHGIEIINLRNQLDKTEGAVASAITKLEASLQGIGHSIEGKVSALHQRFDRLLMDSGRHRGGDGE